MPILILTAFSDEEYKIDAFTNLADGYIEKPFSLPVLKAKLFPGEVQHFLADALSPGIPRHKEMLNAAGLVVYAHHAVRHIFRRVQARI